MCRHCGEICVEIDVSNVQISNFQMAQKHNISACRVRDQIPLPNLHVW